ncbi:hypothetical protein XELAEV_18000915mg [Xenopus laevis]|nr:hypothetical protein XELAEV_18000915mg [Xenopus laevis]
MPKQQYYVQKTKDLEKKHDDWSLPPSSISLFFFLKTKRKKENKYIFLVLSAGRGLCYSAVMLSLTSASH